MIRSSRSGLAVAALIAALACASTRAVAQPAPDDGLADPYAPTPTPTPVPAPGSDADADVDDERQREIDDAVAEVLYERGKTLYAEGDHLNAKQMFVESLERSSKGPVSTDTRALLRATNERLGVTNLDDGNPSVAPTQPLDPYGGTGGPGADLLDPYGGEDPVLDPYGGMIGPGTRDDLDGAATARRRVAMWSAGLGALLGLAVAGPQDEFGDTRGAAILA
ncbi:MAG TPA: hypothetical protein VML75_26560, partial [Kofleriaceae bacterium]|nr:hypothetical protein [Kofleriaceae bacterium]